MSGVDISVSSVRIIVHMAVGWRQSGRHRQKTGRSTQGYRCILVDGREAFALGPSRCPLVFDPGTESRRVGSRPRAAELSDAGDVEEEGRPPCRKRRFHTCSSSVQGREYLTSRGSVQCREVGLQARVADDGLGRSESRRGCGLPTARAGRAMRPVCRYHIAARHSAWAAHVECSAGVDVAAWARKCR